MKHLVDTRYSILSGHFFIYHFVQLCRLCRCRSNFISHSSGTKYAIFFVLSVIHYQDRINTNKPAISYCIQVSKLKHLFSMSPATVDFWSESIEEWHRKVHGLWTLWPTYAIRNVEMIPNHFIYSGSNLTHSIKN